MTNFYFNPKLPSILILLLAHLGACTKSLFCDMIVPEPNHITCLIEDENVIDAKDVELSSNANATLLKFFYNSKIKFLPIKVSKVFPFLLDYDANGNMVLSISCDNFEGLSHLKDLNLASNRIEEIERETFSDLVSLKQLDLSELDFVSLFFNYKFSNYQATTASK